MQREGNNNGSTFSLKRILGRKSRGETNTEGEQTKSKKCLPFRKACKKILRRTRSAEQSSDEAGVSSKNVDQENQNKGQPSGMRKFEDFHKAMNPQSPVPAARITLTDQPEDQSHRFTRCWRWMRNRRNRTKRKSKYCGLCRRKRKKLTEEERNLLRTTDLSSMFVPLQKSSGASTPSRSKNNTPDSNINGPEMKDGTQDQVKGQGRKDNSHGNSSKGTERTQGNLNTNSGQTHENKAQGFEMADESPVREPKEKHENDNEESEKIDASHNEKPSKENALGDRVDESARSDSSEKYNDEISSTNHNVRWANGPKHGEAKNREEDAAAGTPRSKSHDNYINPTDYRKMCCYLCTQKAAGLAAEYIRTREKCCDISIQTFMGHNVETRESTQKLDKSCNHIPRMRTIRASVNVTSSDKNTGTDVHVQVSTRTKETVKPAHCPGKCRVLTREAEKFESELAKICVTERTTKYGTEKKTRKKQCS